MRRVSIEICLAITLVTQPAFAEKTAAERMKTIDAAPSATAPTPAATAATPEEGAKSFTKEEKVSESTHPLWGSWVNIGVWSAAVAGTAAIQFHLGREIAKRQHAVNSQVRNLKEKFPKGFAGEPKLRAALDKLESREKKLQTRLRDLDGVSRETRKAVMQNFAPQVCGEYLSLLGRVHEKGVALQDHLQHKLQGYRQQRPQPADGDSETTGGDPKISESLRGLREENRALSEDYDQFREAALELKPEYERVTGKTFEVPPPREELERTLAWAGSEPQLEHRVVREIVDEMLGTMSQEQQALLNMYGGPLRERMANTWTALRKNPRTTIAVGAWKATTTPARKAAPYIIATALAFGINSYGNYKYRQGLAEGGAELAPITEKQRQAEIQILEQRADKWQGSAVVNAISAVWLAQTKKEKAEFPFPFEKMPLLADGKLDIEQASPGAWNLWTEAKADAKKDGAKHDAFQSLWIRLFAQAEGKPAPTMKERDAIFEKYENAINGAASEMERLYREQPTLLKATQQLTQEPPAQNKP